MELKRIIKLNGVLVIGAPDYGHWEWRAMEFLYKKIHPLGYATEHINKHTFIK